MTKEKIKYVTQSKRRLSVIENYYEQGLLGIVVGRWSPEDRLNIGLRLARDFYLSRLSSVSAIDYSKDRVDTSINIKEPDYVLCARDRYNKAIRSIPSDFYPAVSEVCCYNRLIKGKGSTERQRRYDRYNKICDLCRGLDYLIKFYLGIGVRSL